MAGFIGKLMAGARRYTVLDFGALKLALLFAGILLGVYFGEFFSRHLAVIWALAAVFYGYIVAVTLYKAFGKRAGE